MVGVCPQDPATPITNLMRHSGHKHTSTCQEVPGSYFQDDQLWGQLIVLHTGTRFLLTH